VKRSSRRTIALPTPEKLKNAALFYLSRYAASASSLRRVLRNRLRRAAMAHPDFAADRERQAELRDVIERIIATHEKTGAVNDAAYAEMKVAGLRRSGRSGRFIRQKLAERGIAAALAQSALSEHDGDADGEEAEIKAALACAKRRRLGPFRKKAKEAGKGRTGDKENREEDMKNARKDFATLARAGFSAAIIRKILKASADDGAEGWE
jgi:regulatory protein